MNAEWRLLLTALRSLTRFPGGHPTPAHQDLPSAATKYAPVIGIAIGAIGGAVYWLAAQVWPTSVAVIVSMLVTAAVTEHVDRNPVRAVFALLIKYDALMALSAANLPFPVPANLALGLIVTCGYAASCTLKAVATPMSTPGAAPSSLPSLHTTPAGRTTPASHPTSTGGLALTLGIGSAPALLLGIPGLAGLAAAIAAGLLARRREQWFSMAQPLTEVSFYLGALATWKYS